MSQSSILGGERAPQQARGRDAETLGPSDTSDSGSDIQGASRLKTDTPEGELGGATPVDTESDSDAMGTGDRAEAVPEGAPRRRRHRPRPDRALEGRARFGRFDHRQRRRDRIARRRLRRRQRRRRRGLTAERASAPIRSSAIARSARADAPRRPRAGSRSGRRSRSRSPGSGSRAGARCSGRC